MCIRDSYITLDAHNRIPEIQVASGETWKKLSAEDQAIILSCARQSALYERQLWNEREEESRKKLEAAGCQVTVLNEREQRRFEAMAKTVYTVSYTHLDVYKRQADT